MPKLTARDNKTHVGMPVKNTSQGLGLFLYNFFYKVNKTMS